MSVAPDHLLVERCIGPRELVDRERVLAILRKRFPGSSLDQFAAAANALLGLRCEWREVASFEFAEGRRFKIFEHILD